MVYKRSRRNPTGFKATYARRSALGGSTTVRNMRKSSAYRSRLPARLRGYAQLSTSRALSQEIKFFDDDFTVEVAPGSSAQGTSYKPIVGMGAGHIKRGTGNSERIGQRINLRSLMLKLQVATINDRYISTNQCDHYTTMAPVRIVVVLDQQSNGSSPTLNEVLEPAGIASNDLYKAFNVLKNSMRFKILKNMDLRVPCQVNSDPNGNTRMDGLLTTSCYIKWPKGMSIVIDGSDGTLGEFTSNNIFVWAMFPLEMNPAGGQDRWKVFYTSRVRYTDS